jgi:hypothetical protein
MITLNLGDHYRINMALRDAGELVIKERDLSATILSCRQVLQEQGINWDKEFTAMEREGDNRLAKLHRAEAKLADLRRQIVDTLTPVIEPLWAEWWAVTKEEQKRKFTPEEDGVYQRISTSAIWVMDVLERLLPPEEYQKLSLMTGRMSEEDIEVLFEAEKLPREGQGGQLALLGEESLAGGAR